ncbi:FG-GAP-like repeat-containing protein, partial [Pantanalinema sp. GBBB05]|uniref:beta strand repeat-containing protein n=1 Tax=Pantanalinema sp. GBBB05 TaxID=2604139 RepID=UPI001DFD8B0E|nr:hypothetical protein [Pantanalinema sp. GBBB05]
ATATAVSNVNDVPTGTISITGTVQENQTLTADTSGLSDADGLGTFSYQWQQSSDGVNWTNVTGATNVNFTPGDAQVGQRLRVQVSYTDGQGTAEGPLSSTATATAVTNVNDAPTGTIAITGTVQENQTLTADTSGLSDADGLGAFSYQWQQSSDGVNWTNVTGATNVNFTPGDAQVGQRLRVQVSYTDGQGTTEGPLSSTATATAVSNVNDVPTGTISITGTAQENQTLTANTSGLSDGDGLGSFNYQWQQSSDGVNWTNVTGATNVNFTPGDAQVGQRLRVQVSYTDGQGTAEGPLSSTATATAVTNVNDAPTGTIAITGTVQENQALTADTSGLSDADGLGAFNYQWQQSSDGINWTNVTGATNVNFTPGDAQVGQRLRVQVSYTDGQGTAEGPISSTATATAVSNVNDVPTGTISITGTAQENQTLTANTSGLSDGDGLGSFNYQWQQSSDGVNWTNVTGATNVNFTPDDAQVGKQLRAQISYTDGQGTAESVFSDPTASITGVNDAPTLNGPTSINVTENTPTAITGIIFSDVDAGTGTLTATFTIPAGTLAAISGNGVTVGGTATNLTLSGTLANINAFITAGSLKYTTATNSLTAQTLNVTINDNGTGGIGGSLTANTTINLPVTPQPPAVSISNVSHSEGTRGNKTYTFTVALSKASNQTITINYATADGTAKVSDNDYVVANGTLTFNPGDPLTKTFTVTVNGDSKLEATENFQINLSLVSGTATIANTTALGIIGDDDGNGLDINLDGTVDSFWRNESAGVSGIWFMNGTSLASTAALPSVNSDWRMEETGDFNDDGIDDFFWHNTATGQTGIWLMNQTGGIASIVSSLTVSADWRLEEVGDFNGDNKVDMLWRNASTGDNGIWLMNGTTYSTSVALLKADSSWEIAAVGDFDGDKNLDILWRNTVTGANGIWHLNNTSFSSATALATATPGWTVADVADLDADGDLDILWHNTTTADVGIWKMNNSSVAPGGYLALPRLMSDPGWRIRGIIDVEGDGKLEIFWRHLTLGANGIWRMDGVNYSGNAAVPAADPSWSTYIEG